MIGLVGAPVLDLHPELRRPIREGVTKPCKATCHCARSAWPAHFAVEIQYRRAYEAYHFGFYPGAVQKDDVTVRFENDSLL